MKKIKIGLLGFGNIGKEIWRYFAAIGDSQLQDYEIAAIGVRDSAKSRTCDIPVPKNLLTTRSIEEIIQNSDIDMIVNTVGGCAAYNEDALRFTQRALEAGKHLVTCNKNTIATHLLQLTSLANERKVNLRYEPSVCGGIPIIRTLTEYFKNDEIISLRGIFNGTSNYITTRMQEGETFHNALENAQKLGYAETDPARDVCGIDTVEKLAILASLAFKTEILPDHVSLVEGIHTLDQDDFYAVKEEISRKRGKPYVIKPIAIAKKSGSQLELRVHPAYISREHPLAGIHGVENAVVIEARYAGTYTLVGRGAGPRPTAHAMIADMLDIGSCIRAEIFRNFSSFDKRYLLPESRSYLTQGYLKSTSPAHLAGVFAKKCSSIASSGISIRDVHNFPETKAIGDNQHLPDIIVTEPAREEQIQQAREAIAGAQGYVLGNVSYLREDSFDVRIENRRL